MASMVVHDRRLLGGTPAFYNFVMQVNAGTSINHIISTVTGSARKKGRLRRLHILCHGFEANWDMGAGMSVPEQHGGFGLQVGTQGLNLFNYGLTSAWSRLIDEIVLFSCAPADTGAGNAGTWGDGRRFCGYLALMTNAHIIAARDTQTYNSTNMAIPIDFGPWEGPLYDFSPANPEGVLVPDPTKYKTQKSAADILP